MNALDTDRLLTVKEAAQSLGVHPNWVYREAAAGRLPSVLLGSQTRRFRPAQLASYLDGLQREQDTRRRRHG